MASRCKTINIAVTPPRDITIAIVQLPHISNFTDFNALAAQPDVRIRYIRRPEALTDADLVILPGSKNTLSDLAWLRESGMADALLQTHRQGVPVMGICGGYQMLGDTIVDEVESGLGTQPGLGLLNTITRFAQDKITTQVNATMSGELPSWLAAAAGLPVRGYEIHMGGNGAAGRMLYGHDVTEKWMLCGGWRGHRRRTGVWHLPSRPV